jgi:hypothetical protein
MPPMDSAESEAKKYLKKIFTDIVYEPDGNIPPDFLCDGYLAVEVRRLTFLEEIGNGKWEIQKYR